MKKFLLCCIFLLTFCKAFAQQFELIVSVVDDYSRSVRGAAVSLLNESKTGITDANGQYIFKELPPATYDVRVQLTDYKSVEKKVNISSNPVSLRIRLYPVSHTLQEVVVQNLTTAKRRNTESLNLEVVNKNFIERYLGGSLMQTLQRLPGIKTIGIGSGQSKPLIRGLGFNRVMVIDKGIKHEGQQWGADHGLEIDQFAADEVELVKGAASFAYGPDAIAGVINIKPPKIPVAKTFGGELNLIGKSNNDLLGTSAHLFNRKDKWFTDARITYQNYGDYKVPVNRLYIYDLAVDLHKNNLRNTAGNETGIHFNTGYIGEKFRSFLNISNVSSQSGFFANAHGLEPRRVNTELHDKSNRDIQYPQQQVNHFKVISRSALQLERHLLEADAGYQKNFRQEHNVYVNHGYMPALYPDSIGIPKNLERQFDKQVFSLNIKDHIDLNNHQLQAGINTEVQKNNITGWSFLAPAFDQQLAGAFMYDKWKVNEQLLLHGALRYDHAQIQLHRYTDWFASNTIINGKEVSQYIVRSDELNRRFNSFVWSLGANYNIEKFEFKINAGKSFRIPIAKELGANGVNYHYFSYEKGNAALGPERSYQADVSVLFKQDKLSAQLSPFFNYFPNYIYLNPTAEHDYFYGAGNQVFEYAQSRVMRYGGELQLKYAFTENLNTSVLAEYLYALQLSGDKKGYTLPFSPPPSALFNITYQPVHTRKWHHTYFSVDYRLTAAQNNIVPPEKKSAGYHLFDLQAGTQLLLKQQAITVSLQVQNIFNTVYLNHTSFYRLIGLPEQGRSLVMFVKIPFTLKQYKK